MVEEHEEQQQQDPEPKVVNYDDYDVYVKDLARWEVRQAMGAPPPPPPPKSPEDQAYEEAIDPDTGEYRSLGHLLAYTEASPAIPEGCPISPYNYTSEQEDAFHEDLRNWKLAQSVAGALRPKLGPPPMPPYVDDPHRGEREAIKARIEDYEAKAADAKKRGESRSGYTARDYDERAAQWERELAKLPPEPAQQFVEDYKDGVTDKAVGLLFDKNHVDDPIWDDPRMLHDAPLEVLRANERNRSGIVRLPIETDGPFGNLAPCKPRNMVKFRLPMNVFESLKRYVSAGGGDDPNTKLRRTWAFLHRSGYASTGTRAFEGEANEGEETYKQFAARRNKEDERRKKPFVFPKPRFQG